MTNHYGGFEAVSNLEIFYGSLNGIDRPPFLVHSKPSPQLLTVGVMVKCLDNGWNTALSPVKGEEGVKVK